MRSSILTGAGSGWWRADSRSERSGMMNIIRPRPRRELEDLEGRLEDMDRMGVDVQVLFPTFFIRYISLNPEPEAALASAYNRWVAERCDQTGGRLRWGGSAAVARHRRCHRGVAVGERERCLRHLQARAGPPETGGRPALLPGVRGGERPGHAALCAHRPPQAATGTAGSP